MFEVREFVVKDYMILSQNEYKGRVTYKVELTLKDQSHAMRGDEVRNVPGEMWVVTAVTPEKLTIIGDSMDHLLKMSGQWIIGNHYQIES